MSNQLPPPTSLCEFTQRVLCLCAIHDASVGSWVRSEGHNAYVGGSAKSAHRIARGAFGADVVLDQQGDPECVSAFCKDAKKLGLRYLDKTDHIHLQGLAPVGDTN
jgi:hypothetical protein